MKKLSLVLLFTLAACAKEKSGATVSAGSGAVDSSPISPASVPGLWADKGDVAAMRASRTLSDDTCDQSKAAGIPLIDILLFHKDGNVYHYDPNRRTRAEDRLLRLQGKTLLSVEPGARDSATLHRTATGVRLHYRFENPANRRSAESDAELSHISAAEARELARLAQLCASAKPAGRLLDARVGTGLLMIDGPTGVDDVPLNAERGSPVLCAGSPDGSRIYMESTRPQGGADLFAVAGIQLSFPSGKNYLQPVSREASLGGKELPVQVVIHMAGDLGSYSGRCAVQVKQSSFVLDAKIRCDRAKRTSPDGLVQSTADIQAQLTCNRFEIPRKR